MLGKKSTDEIEKILSNNYVFHLASGETNPELICFRELLEFKNDWKYVITKGRHSLPLGLILVGKMTMYTGSVNANCATLIENLMY